MVLSLNSVSPGMAFPASGKKAPLPLANFLTQGKTNCSLLSAEGAEEVLTPMQNTGNFMQKMDILLHFAELKSRYTLEA